ncbi:axial regulator YABBY 5-like isoform X2 [Nymphaea colorata]|uniref:axial regulator YABBY 5-like isoform X2 n=1 Tax=Nymphaea colorata TaxID=210225 RepID=UPI00129DDFBF|nr:axial regulator YABBY 5-like isoform X2 [Nymphaea colorata]
MSTEVGNEHVYYLPCSFCNTILAVSVPCSNLFNILTIRCGHCSNLQSTNMGALLPTPIPFKNMQNLQTHVYSPQQLGMEFGSSSSRLRTISMMSHAKHAQRLAPNRPPEKRQRVPSAYNRFIKEEIQRIKACNPHISHKEAFSTAAKNWAHFPHIQFGLASEGNKQAKLDEPFYVEALP